MPTHDGFLGVSLATLRELVPLARGHLFVDHLLDDLLCQNLGLLLRIALCQDLFGFLVVLNEGR